MITNKKEINLPVNVSQLPCNHGSVNLYLLCRHSSSLISINPILVCPYLSNYLSGVLKNLWSTYFSKFDQMVNHQNSFRKSFLVRPKVLSALGCWKILGSINLSKFSQMIFSSSIYLSIYRGEVLKILKISQNLNTWPNIGTFFGSASWLDQRLFSYFIYVRCWKILGENNLD